MSESHDEAAVLAGAVTNGFELVRLLELLGERCTRAGAWKWHVILLTVELPEPYLIGTDGARLWMKPAGTDAYLHGFTSSEFLARYYDVAPAVKLDAAIWRFERNSSAPFAERFTEVTRPLQRARVHAAVLAAAADLDRFSDAQRGGGRPPAGRAAVADLRHVQPVRGGRVRREAAVGRVHRGAGPAVVPAGARRAGVQRLHLARVVREALSGVPDLLPLGVGLRVLRERGDRGLEQLHPPDRRGGRALARAGRGEGARRRRHRRRPDAEPGPSRRVAH